MKTCPKCKSKNSVHVHDFLSGGGSTENRQSGEKSDNKDSAWRCVLCGHYKAIVVVPMPMKKAKEYDGRRDMVARAEEIKTKYSTHNKLTTAELDKFLAEKAETIKGWYKIQLAQTRMVIQLSKLFGKKISMSSFKRRWAKYLETV